MKTRLFIAALSVILLVTVGTASAYEYGYDPAKAPLGGNNSMYMELAQNPTYIQGGPYAGKYEYFFDLYNVSTTFYLFHLVGLDNSKIANKFQDRPDGGLFRTQRWGDTDMHGNLAIYETWPVATGRLLEIWSQRNISEAAATQFDVSVTSYDDGAGGWTDTGFGYPGTSTANPHSYSEYVDFTGGGGDIWKAELTGPGQPLHWFNTQFGVVPSQDVIFVPGATAWSPPWFGGLVLTMRIVYDEEIDPETIGWGGNATMDYDVMGDFTVTGLVTYDPGDVNEDGVINGEDIDLMGDYILTGIAPTTGNYDLSDDGVTGGTNGAIDINDLDYLVRYLVETSAVDGDGNPIFGTQYGDFNLDGEIELGDLTRLGTYYGVGSTWAEGNANPHLDTDIELGDLTILGTYYGVSNGGVDAIPEPATISLLLLGAAAALRRRRKA